MKPFEPMPPLGASAFPASSNDPAMFGGAPASGGPAHFAFQSTQSALTRKALPGPTWLWGVIGAAAAAVLAWVVTGTTSPAPSKHAANTAQLEAPAEPAAAAEATPGAPTPPPEPEPAAVAAAPAPAAEAPAAAADDGEKAAPAAAEEESAAKPERTKKAKTKKRGRATRASRKRAAEKP